MYAYQKDLIAFYSFAQVFLFINKLENKFWNWDVEQYFNVFVQ